MGKKKKKFYFIHSFGQDDYFSALKIISGVIAIPQNWIIEVPSFKIGTINIGERQKGRIFPQSVINCNFDAKRIEKNIIKIISKKFRNNIKKITILTTKKIL